jgi:hypothetical protein
LSCLFCRRADTGVLSLAPLKRVALSAHATPSEPHSKPPYADPLLVQDKEGLVVAVEVEEIVALVAFIYLGVFYTMIGATMSNIMR